MEETWQVQVAFERGEHLRRATALALLAPDALAVVSVRDGLVHVDDDCLDPAGHQARELTPAQVLALLCTPGGPGPAAGGMELLLCSCYWRSGWWHDSGTSVCDEAVALLEVVRATHWLQHSDGGAVFNGSEATATTAGGLEVFDEAGGPMRWCSRAVAQLYTLQHTRAVLTGLRRGARKRGGRSSQTQVDALDALTEEVDGLVSATWQLLGRYRAMEPDRLRVGRDIVAFLAAAQSSAASDHPDVAALEAQRLMHRAWLPGTVGAALLERFVDSTSGSVDDVDPRQVWEGAEHGLAVWVEVPVTTATAEAFAGAVAVTVDEPGVVWAQRRSRAFLKCDVWWLMSVSDKVAVVAPPAGVSLREFAQLDVTEVQAATRMAAESAVSAAEMMRAFFASRS